MEAEAFTHPLALEGLKKGLRMNRGWFVVHKRTITMYEQAQKEILEEIETEDQILLKKREERSEESRNKRQGAKMKDKRNKKDVSRPEPKSTFRKGEDF